MAKLPSLQFYPADWRKDPGVQSLSFHDRGVWFEILCLMHESEQRGKLLLNGKPMPEEALARLLGLDKQILTKTLTTLEEYGVASRDENGALMNRRMVRDENLRIIRQEAGKKGGNPVLVKQNPTKTKKKLNQKSTPSSSSSSSDNNSEAKASGDESPQGRASPTQESGSVEIKNPVPPQPIESSEPDTIWTMGLGMLKGAGIEDRDARKFLGGMAKRYGRTELITAIGITSTEKPADPQGYLVKVLENGKNGNRKSSAGSDLWFPK